MRNNLKSIIAFVFLIFFLQNAKLFAQINNGERIKSDATGIVYLCMDDQLMKIEDTINWTNVFSKPENVKVVPESEIQKIPITTTIKKAYLAKADDAAVFLIIDGKKRHISSPEVFDQYGFNWNKIITMSNKELWNIPTDNPIKMNSLQSLEQPLPCGTR